MRLARLLNLDKGVPQALRRRVALQPGDALALDAYTLVVAQADTDRPSNRRCAVLEVCQPGQIVRHRIEDGRFVQLWLNGHPSALVPRAVEFDGAGRVRCMVVDVVFHQEAAARIAA